MEMFIAAIVMLVFCIGYVWLGRRAPRKHNSH